MMSLAVATAIAIPEMDASATKDSRATAVKMKVLSVPIFKLAKQPAVATVNAHPKDAFAISDFTAKIAPSPDSTASIVRTRATTPMANATKKTELANARKASEASTVPSAAA